VTSLSEKKIHIIGPQRVQNELLASYLALETGATCRSVTSLQDVQAGDNGSGGHPNLALWDCSGRTGVECLSKLDCGCRQVLTEDYLALFNMMPLSGIEEEAVEKGVRGFFYLEESLKQLGKGVLAIFNGELWIPRKLMSELIVRSRKRNHFLGDDPLTAREMEILQMVAAGYSNSRIAEELFISHHTVKTHLYTIYKKIEVPSRVQAALWTVKNL
jgi:LuxR family transcriptional regulator, positive regulator of biofilm formation